MSWHDIRSKLHAIARPFDRFGQSVATHAVASVARITEDISMYTPLADLFSASADRLERFAEPMIAPRFPHTLPVPQLSSYTALPPGQPASVVPKKGYALTQQQPTQSFGLTMAKDGDARLDLTAGAPGTNWSKKGAESATMSVYVDGKYQQDVVLYGGATSTPYALALGKLPAGKHVITLRYADEKSTRGASGVTVSAGTATAVTYPDQQAQWAADNAPVLIGRHGLENTYNDTPMAMQHTIVKNADGTTTIRYTTIFSNEDTGDGLQPAVEAALWGRLSDHETMFSVTLAPDGHVLSRLYEGPGHVWAPFKGQYQDGHPVVRTSTDNNNVSDQGGGPLRFWLPSVAVPDNAPPEDILRQNPRFFEITNKELLREGKIDPKGVGSTPMAGTWGELKAAFDATGLGSKQRMADLRNYLFVQLDATGATKDPIDVHVTLKNGQSFDSDLGVRAVADSRDGWSQTTVRLPPGTKPSDVAKVQFVSRGTGKATQVGHVFMLDRQYQPQELSLGGPLDVADATLQPFDPNALPQQDGGTPPPEVAVLPPATSLPTASSNDQTAAPATP